MMSVAKKVSLTNNSIMALITRFKDISNTELPNIIIFHNYNRNARDEDELSEDAPVEAYKTLYLK